MTRIDKQRDPEKKYTGRRIDRIITTISWLVECMGLMVPYKINAQETTNRKK